MWLRWVGGFQLILQFAVAGGVSEAYQRQVDVSHTSVCARCQVLMMRSVRDPPLWEDFRTINLRSCLTIQAKSTITLLQSTRFQFVNTGAGTDVVINCEPGRRFYVWRCLLFTKSNEAAFIGFCVSNKVRSLAALLKSLWYASWCWLSVWK